MSILINVLLVIHVLISLLIILVVLMQRPKNEGLGAAFGGGMTDNLFGAQTTNVLQSFTRWLGGIFFVVTIALSWLYVRQTTTSNVQRTLAAPTAPAAAPTAPAPNLNPAVEGGTAPSLQTLSPVVAPPVTLPDASPAAPTAPTTENLPAPTSAPAPANPTTPANPGGAPGGTGPAAPAIPSAVPPATPPAPAPAPAPGSPPANPPQ